MPETNNETRILGIGIPILDLYVHVGPKYLQRWEFQEGEIFEDRKDIADEVKSCFQGWLNGFKNKLWSFGHIFECKIC